MRYPAASVVPGHALMAIPSVPKYVHYVGGKTAPGKREAIHKQPRFRKLKRYLMPEKAFVHTVKRELYLPLIVVPIVAISWKRLSLEECSRKQ